MYMYVHVYVHVCTSVPDPLATLAASSHPGCSTRLLGEELGSIWMIQFCSGEQAHIIDMLQFAWICMGDLNSANRAASVAQWVEYMSIWNCVSWSRISPEAAW